MTLAVEIYIDPSCPWAWITHGWLQEVAPARGLDVRWRPYCLEIRDDYDVSPAIRPERRELVLAAHQVSHGMLRVMEAARAEHGDSVVEPLYAAWGKRFFGAGDRAETVIADVVSTCGLDPDLLAAVHDERWDEPIVAAMDIAYAFGGPKTQTPTIVVRDDPPHGFKGPVMAPAPTGDAAVELWDAIEVLARQPAFFEITRPRANRPTPIV